MESYFTKNEKAAIKEFHTDHFEVSLRVWNLLNRRFFSEEFEKLSHKYLREQMLLTDEMTFLLSCIGIYLNEFIDAQDVRIFIINLEREIKSLL